ncbi:MAG: urea ABC transporter substrate-binding protein [Solirubrobacteraceae bacterium]|nr:urea ABC transporter substrate-binding protein [Patulibacter sp.]
MSSTDLKRISAAALLAVGLSTGVAACGKSDSASSGGTASASADSGNVIKVGVLHSLSGTMSISEVAVEKSELMAIDEINASGGVLGKQLKPVIKDGASDWPTFAEKAQELISQDKVAVTFGGWTSASRKAMLPVFEKNKSLLFYPVQYEGLESSPYIFYGGATTNQQIIPALEYMKEKGQTKVFLIGSDYVFPRTANKEIKAWAAANGMTILGEEYTPLGSTEYETLINKIKATHPDAIFNTLNGDSNVAFFKQFKAAGMSCATTQVMSVSIAEEEVGGVGVDNVKGCLTAWNYYQTDPGAVNAKFVKDYQAKYGATKHTDDPIEAGYVNVKLWAKMAEKAGSVDPEKIKAVADGTTLDAPEGLVTVDGENHHIYKTARIGEIQSDGLIKTIWDSGKPIKPDPYLKGYSWWKG